MHMALCLLDIQISSIGFPSSPSIYWSDSICAETLFFWFSITFSISLFIVLFSSSSIQRILLFLLYQLKMHLELSTKTVQYEVSTLQSISSQLGDLWIHYVLVLKLSITIAYIKPLSKSFLNIYFRWTNCLQYSRFKRDSSPFTIPLKIIAVWVISYQQYSRRSYGKPSYIHSLAVERMHTGGLT